MTLYDFCERGKEKRVTEATKQMEELSRKENKMKQGKLHCSKNPALGHMIDHQRAAKMRKVGCTRLGSGRNIVIIKC